MCEIVSIGPDEDGAYFKEEGAKFIVYWYENYGYEGSGDAIACDKDGQLWHQGLSHCSCNDPWDDGWCKVDIGDIHSDSVHDLGLGQVFQDTVVALMKKYA